MVSLHTHPSYASSPLTRWFFGTAIVAVGVLLLHCGDVRGTPVRPSDQSQEWEPPSSSDTNTNETVQPGEGAVPADSSEGAGAEAPSENGAETAPPSCSLTESGPVVASSDGQLIQNLRISVTSGEAAIVVRGLTGVVVRNVEIYHSGAAGIVVDSAPDTTLDSVRVIYTGRARGQIPNPSREHYNVKCSRSDELVVYNARLERGTSGIYAQSCPNARLRNVSGANFASDITAEGKTQRGQLVQFNNCPDSILEDFAVYSDPGDSYPEDNVSLYDCRRCVVRRGLIDGNNSVTGVGVMVEQDHDQGLPTQAYVEDVDAIHMSNGCFSFYPASASAFVRTRCRDNICSDQGRGPPKSGGMGWVASPEATDNFLIAASYDNLCSGVSWAPTSGFAVKELAATSFTPRTAPVHSFCWDE